LVCDLCEPLEQLAEVYDPLGSLALPIFFILIETPFTGLKTALDVAVRKV